MQWYNPAMLDNKTPSRWRADRGPLSGTMSHPEGFFLYEQIVQVGLIVGLWFAAWAHGAHDLWAASFLFGWLTLIFAVFCAGRFYDRAPTRLPLLGPTALWLAAAWLSVIHSYDVESTLLETWGWTFMTLAFFLAVNVLSTEARR